MTQYTTTIFDEIDCLETIDALDRGKGISSGVRFGEGVLQVNKRYSESDAFGIGVNLASTEVIRPGRIISEVIRLQEGLTPNVKYTWTVAEQMYLAQALSAGVPMRLSDGIGAHGALTASIAVTILQGLGIAPTPLPSLKYTRTLLEGIGLSDSFRRFFGGDLSDHVGVAQTLSKKFVAHPQVSEGIGIAPALSQHLYIRVTMADTIGVDDTDVLKLIYNGQLADGVEIVAGYVSPDGQFTTWAINTRTGATTEYSNYAFNSFAKIGNIHYGASSTGLYKLTGDSDAGANIIADIKSGFAQWAGTKLSMFKGAYLGVRGGGDFVLKLITGDDKTYTYAVSAQDMRTTKINIGKGLRARYFAFELISTGQDFDLDTIEFVPLAVDRRV